MADNLYTYRNEPFQLLRLMEQKCRAVNKISGGGSDRKEWVGVAFRIGTQTFMTSRSDVKEVLAVLPTTRVPGAKAWVKGLANLRSQLMPVIDLVKYVGAGDYQATGQERMLVINHDKIPAALIVDEVMGFRRFSDSELSKKTPQIDDVQISSFVLGSCTRAESTWSVLGLRKLLESQDFMQAGALN